VNKRLLFLAVMLVAMLATFVNVAGGATNPHANLVWADYPSKCLNDACHTGTAKDHKSRYNDMYQGVHYQWLGDAKDNANQPLVKQGKISNSVNSYCVNILGNWAVCGRCHAGRGAQPVATTSPTDTQLANIDCLMCHNEDYAAARVRLSDGSMGPSTTDTATLDGYVKNITKPTRKNCIMCHARAGGGDALKRGTLALASISTTDRGYDVHLSTTGANLTCQACHKFTGHKVIGKGSDIRQMDYSDASNPHSEVTCSNSTCHPNKASSTGHTTAAVNDHVARVACQTCHVPTYGKNAGDTAASEATEVHRTWKTSTFSGGQYHPSIIRQNDLMPKYKFWDRRNNSYLLHDLSTIDAATGYRPTSRPVGSVDGALGTKLYPFKYKTAEQPMVTADKKLIALDTYEFLVVSGDATRSVEKGLVNMGLASTTAWEWAITDTYQLLNHQVSPTATRVLQCNDCHANTTRMNLVGELGYNLKNTKPIICSQCHVDRNWPNYEEGHYLHTDIQNWDCSWCHTYSRPEKGGIMPQ